MDGEQGSNVAYCRACGKALIPADQRQVQGTIYCEEHAPKTAPPQPAASYGTPPPSAPAPGAVSPGLAFLLGLIPGVGAIYNAQYAKGLVHVVIFGLLISVMTSGNMGDLEPLFGMMAPIWVLYMAFEAYHTAKKREHGEPVDEFSSILPLKGAGGGFPVAPVVLIVAGVIFLLNNLEVFRIYQLLKYWPALLILLGVYLLVARTNEGSAQQISREAANEQR